MDYSQHLDEKTLHEMMAEKGSDYYTILDLVIKIFEYEYSRFDRIAQRHQQLKKRCGKQKSLIAQLERDTKSINQVITKQNQIFHLCLEIFSKMCIVDFHYQSDDVYPRV